MQSLPDKSRLVLKTTFAVAMVLTVFCGATAQSSSQEAPTPVTSNQLSATIPALDIGDPRLTRHFYIFTGNRGDVTISVESKNLNGDVDVFTAGDLRPLTKITMYAGTDLFTAQKTVFLHQREPLLVRVEARSPDDNAGNYRLTFGGAFEPIAATDTETDTGQSRAGTSSRSKNTRRVTSTGALIEEPIRPAENTAATRTESVSPTPTPSPTPSPADSSSTASNSSGKSTMDTTAKSKTSAKTTPKRTPARRTTRGSTARSTSTRPPKTTTTKPATNSGADTTTPTSASSSTTTASDAATGVKPKSPPKQDVVAPPSGHLVIELKDGTKIDQSMTTLRRVTIDNGQIIIFHNNGRIERVLMSNVVRMSIEP